MTRILDRYILREVAYTWFAVTGVLLVILLSNQFARVLGRAAAGKLPKDAVFTLLGLTSVQYLTVLVPVALFLSIMLALGRLYQDNEMAAVMGCGVGPARLYRPLMVWAAILAALLAWLSLDIGPWAAAQIEVVINEGKREVELQSLEPGRFALTNGGEVVFYAEGIGPDGVMENVFVQRRQDDRIEVVVAARGAQKVDEIEDRRTLVLYDGRRYEGVPGTSTFRITRFAEHGIPIQLPQPTNDVPEEGAVPTAVLLRSADPRDIVELQWRLSVPLSAVLLTLLAVPLSRSYPRQGRYGKLAFAVLIYILYSNLLATARLWTEREIVPAEIGLWWVHALVGGGALALLALQYRVRRLGGAPAAARADKGRAA